MEGFLEEIIMKHIPLLFENKPVGFVEIDEEMVKRLEKSMECKFQDLEKVSFVIASGFVADTKTMTTILKHFEILEKVTLDRNHN